MPRPLPALPLLLPTSGPSSVLAISDNLRTSGNTPEDEGVYPFYFSKPVPPALVMDYNRRRRERELRQESEASHVENERQIKHAILLVAYLSHGATPTFLPLQDIKTWPTLNLMRFPNLRSQLGLDSDDTLELYVSSANGKFWIPTLDHSITVKTDENFLFDGGVLQRHNIHQHLLISWRTYCHHPAQACLHKHLENVLAIWIPLPLPRLLPLPLRKEAVLISLLTLL